jgi:HEAT repeat protein
MTLIPKSGSVMASKKAPTKVAELIAALESPGPVARRKAREALVALGKPAVPSLIQLLSHRKPHVRWEAAKALGGIADPIAASALVNALKDRDGDVRWLAAEGLTALGQDALHPLLAALIERHESDWLCEGAHHVCHVLVKKRGLGQVLQPLLAALAQSEPEAAAPLAAYTALSQLRDLPRGAATSVGSKRRKP